MDPWYILGVNRGATSEAIRKQYRKLAKRYHPDNGGSLKKFLEIQGAYEILKNHEDPLANPKESSHPNAAFRSHTSHPHPIQEVVVDFDDMVRGTAIPLDEKTVLNIPAGVADGAVLQTKSSPRRQARIKVKASTKYRRQGRDLTTNLVLNADVPDHAVEVETPFGWKRLDLSRPSSAEEFVVRQHGIGRVGNLIINLTISPAENTEIPWRRIALNEP